MTGVGSGGCAMTEVTNGASCVNDAVPLELVAGSRHDPLSLAGTFPPTVSVPGSRDETEFCVVASVMTLHA